jgi:hypothetical protein
MPEERAKQSLKHRDDHDHIIAARKNHVRERARTRLPQCHPEVAEEMLEDFAEAEAAKRKAGKTNPSVVDGLKKSVLIAGTLVAQTVQICPQFSNLFG